MEHLSNEGHDPTYGARPLRRAIQKLIEDPLSEKILEGKFIIGDSINVGLKDEQIDLSKKATDKKPTSKKAASKETSKRVKK